MAEVTNLGNQRPLRCEVCGEQIGWMWGDAPTPGTMVLRCYQCAAVEEAESILREAPDAA